MGPSAVILDPLSNIYVSDTLNHRSQFFLTNQTNGSTLCGITGFNWNTNQLLNYLQGIKLDVQLNLYVADTLNHRVQKFLRY
jgi:hypothetical protein